jgi:hypothetical protein
MNDPGLDDYQYLRLIAERLGDTGEFDEVTTTGLPEGMGGSADDARLACLELATWQDVDLYSDPDATPQVRTVHYHLHILVRSEDPDVRDDEVDRLAAVAGAALNGASLGDASFTGKMRLSRGRWLTAAGPERRMHVNGEFSYLIPDLDMQATA